MADAASRDDLYQALRNADAAGDTAAAQRLAQYIQSLPQDDGTPQTSAAAPQYSGPLRLPALASQALAQGTAELAGVPGDAEAGMDWLGNKARNLLFGEPSQEDQTKLETAQRGARLPTGGELVDNLHLQGNALVPTTPLERYGSAGIKAIPGIAASIATGGAAVPMIASGEAGVLSGQAAHDLAPDSTWGPIVAGLVSGLGVGGVTNKVENLLTSRAATKLVGTTASELDSAGAKMAAAKDTAFTGNKSLADNAALLKSASREDFAATRAQLDADMAEHHAAQDAATETVASSLGKSASLQDAGEALQAHARNWISNVLPAKVKALWSPVDAAIPAEAPVDLKAFTGALKDINSSAGELEPLATFLKPGAPKALGKALNGVLGLDDLTSAEGAEPKSFAWGDVQKLRTTLGDALSNPKVINDVGAQNLQRLYATLTADMKSTAAAHGAGDLFDQANSGTRQLYQIGEGPMSKIVSGPRPSAEDPSPEGAAAKLLSDAKKGGTDLATLRREIPGGIDELAAAHLRLNPKGFANLPSDSASALVPDSSAGATVIGAQLAKQGAQEAKAAGYKAAQAMHQGNLDKIAEDTRNGRFENSANVRSSSAELAAAKKAHQAAVAAKAALPSNSLIDHSGTSILGSILGENLGPVADRLLLHNSGLGQAGGALVGAIAPSVVRGTLNLLKPTSSGDFAYPAVAGLTASNALYGKSQ